MTQPLPSLASGLPPSDRLKSNVERLFTLLLPFIAYTMRWEYLVVSATPGVPGVPGTVDGVPVDLSRCPFGPLTGIALWRGPSGVASVPALGSRVLVEFHDGNPAKPAVCGVDPTIPAIVPDVPPAPLTVAGALATFATPLSTGAIDPAVKSASLALLTALVPLL